MIKFKDVVHLEKEQIILHNQALNKLQKDARQQ